MNITISPAGRGRFDARLGDRLLCTSETPFFAAARVLKSEGVPVGAVLTMTHQGSDTVCLRSTVGKAASLTVHESERGLHLRPYKPFPSTRPVAPDSEQVCG